MRSVEIAFELECDCRNIVSVRQPVAQTVKNMAATNKFVCAECGTKFFAHIQEVKPV